MRADRFAEHLLVGSELTDDACLAAVAAYDEVVNRHRDRVAAMQLEAAREVQAAERTVEAARRAYRERTGTDPAAELPPFNYRRS